jgi:hypothetical protein
MPFDPGEPAPGIRGFQIQATDVPTQKLVRFLTSIGSVAMMANKETLLNIGRAMIEVAEKMPSKSDLS